ncbi:MAG: hypothetical protein PHH60_00525 [Candidatus Margulisbacteria bacterium]|nr:hypothetical protein [Candidatus Margulisiibacteriota bacterium]
MQQINQQQLAIASNLAALENLDQVLRSELERKIDTDNSAKVEERIIDKALEGKTAKLGIEILGGLVAKLADTLNPSQKLQGNLEKEFGFLLDSKEEKQRDSIDIRNPITRMTKPQNQNQQQSGSGEQGGDGRGQSPTVDIKEYIGAYSQSLVNGGGETKKKLEQMENRLLSEKGLTLKDLQSMKVQVANTVRTEIMNQLKDSYLKQVLAKSKSVEWLIARKEEKGMVDFAFFNDNLGSFDFGGFEGNLQGTVTRARVETHGELKEFINDELSKQVMKKTMGDTSKAVEKDIDSLIKLGTKVGFDFQSFMAKIPEMADNLGAAPTLLYVGTETNTNDDQREKHQYQFTREEEKEVMTDKLRALYMRRAMYGDLRTVMETQFKMITTKNGLVKLGVSHFDEIEAEGKALAKVKLFDMLNEGFEERATYAKLSGEAWKMTERKIKTVLKNLERLGINLTQVELNQLRDRANYKMFRVAEDELALLNTAIESRGEMLYLTQKRKLAIGIVDRLAQESGFEAPGHEIELSVREAC